MSHKLFFSMTLQESTRVNDVVTDWEQEVSVEAFYAPAEPDVDMPAGWEFNVTNGEGREVKLSSRQEDEAIERAEELRREAADGAAAMAEDAHEARREFERSKQ